MIFNTYVAESPSPPPPHTYKAINQLLGHGRGTGGVRVEVKSGGLSKNIGLELTRHLDLACTETLATRPDTHG